VFIKRLKQLKPNGTEIMKSNLYRKAALFLGCLLLALSASGFTAGQAANITARKNAPLTESEIQKWREDLRYMEKGMEKFHRNLFHTMSKEQFHAAVNDLDKRIPQMARHEIIVELARIAAMVEDGHTNLRLAHEPAVRFHTLPVNLYIFKDGLFIRSADREHAGLVGARVLKIGDASAEEAISKAGDLVGRDNEMDNKFFAPFLLVKPEILHALKITKDLDKVPLTVEKEGKRQTVSIKAGNSTEAKELDDIDTSWLNEPGWVDMRDQAAASIPLWLKDVDNKFRFEFLPESKILYVQINEIGNKKDESLAAFSKRLFAFVEANPVEKLVYDLRLNRGGSGELIKPLVLETIKSKLNQKGKLFTIMGRTTFSAAQFLLDDLEKYTDVIFVGEPSGSKGNAYGDSRRVTLPNSKIIVRVSVYYWQNWKPYDTRQWTAPHLTAELSAEDYRKNFDPAMKAVFDYTPQKSLNEILIDALTKGGVEAAVKGFREFRAQPINRYASVEQPFMEAAQKLLNEKKNDEAARLLEINAEENPHSYRAFFALGEAYFRAGKRDIARRNFEKSLKINPKNYDVLFRMEQLEQTKQ
jgi:hypothetical protein